MKQDVFQKIIHPYTPATINSLEIWLRKKASVGWRLERVHGWIFVFRRCKPYNTRFIGYSSFGTSIGISNDYCASKNRYARNKSTINKSYFPIYEVDINKIDSGLDCFVLMRDKFFLKHYLMLFFFALSYIILAFHLIKKHFALILFGIIGVLLLAYSLWSILILTRDMIRHNRDNRTGDGLREPF